MPLSIHQELDFVPSQHKIIIIIIIIIIIMKKKKKLSDPVEWYLPGLSINVVENFVKEPVYSGDKCSPWLHPSKVPITCTLWCTIKKRTDLLHQK